MGELWEKLVKALCAVGGAVAGLLGGWDAALTFAALDAATPQPSAAAAPLAGEPTYTITIRGVKQAEIEAIRARWPGAEVTQE